MKAFNKILFILLVTSLQQITTADRCPSTWISWGHHCYRFELEKKDTWRAAESRCRALKPNSHLASIHSREEQNFIYEVYRLAVREEPKTAWNPKLSLGLLVGNSATELSWTDGSCVDYVNWFRGSEPNDFPNSAGQITDGRGKHGRWHDQRSPDNLAVHYVCKMPQTS